MPLRRRVSRPFALTAVAALGGCATELGLQPIEVDRRLGEEVSRAVAEEIGLVEDADATRYLNSIGRRLTAGIPNQRFDYVFTIVDQDEPNAFAAPGGYVFVSRGLLVASNSEAELANVLSHEIVHVARRHVARQTADAGVPNLLTLPGRAVGAIIGGDIGDAISSPFEDLQGGLLAGRSREDEHEADRLGQRLAGAAGYDPVALATMLDRLERDAALRGGESHRPGFFDTHPTTPDRVKRIGRHARGVGWEPQPGLEPDRVSFLRRLEGLLVGPNPRHGVVDDNAFLQPDLDFRVEFPAGWRLVNAPRGVFAVPPEPDGLMMLTIQADGSDPVAAAETFMDVLAERLEIDPPRGKPIDLDAGPGYFLAMAGTGEASTNVQFLWLAYGGRIYLLLAVVPGAHRNVVLDAAATFRPLLARERTAIREFRLRLVTAHEGETIEALSRRTGNAWTTDATAVINDLEPGATLEADRIVKIAAVETYEPHRP